MEDRSRERLAAPPRGERGALRPGQASAPPGLKIFTPSSQRVHKPTSMRHFGRVWVSCRTRRPAATRSASSQTSAPDALPPRSDPTTPSARSLDDLRSRIGKCIMFGLTPAQIAKAGLLTQELASDWRTLLAGREGFLTAANRRGLYRQAVVWGEMVSLLDRVNAGRIRSQANMGR